MARTGRPRILTEDLIDQITRVIGPGTRRKDAALAIGVSQQAYYAWLARGNRELARMAAHGLTEPDPDEAIFVEFVEATDHAWAQAKATAITAIRAAMTGRPAQFDRAGNKVADERVPEWRAAAWWLERTYPLEYGRQRIVIEDARQLLDEDGPDESMIAEALADAAEAYLAEQTAADESR